MNKQSLTIEIPQGYEIDSFDKLSGKIMFKEKPRKVTDRVKTVADLLAEHGYTLQRFDELCKDLTIDERAYRILKMLAVSLNEGWTPDWNNYNEGKYYPYFEMGGSSGFLFHDYDCWTSHSSVGSRLCFKTSELAKYAGIQFTDVYKQFMSL
ncbi:hypothetical protein WSM22_03090 [Cytophagales bacterium WSM2-2]|nr:hypothetical protein WSM22_03090 [Cytophagales bacterium WSM2-2]